MSQSAAGPGLTSGYTSHGFWCIGLDSIGMSASSLVRATAALPLSRRNRRTATSPKCPRIEGVGDVPAFSVRWSPSGTIGACLGRSSEASASEPWPCGPHSWARSASRPAATLPYAARPSAKRLCELVLVSQGAKGHPRPGLRALFPDLGPDKVSRALVKALSMARGGAVGPGKPGAVLIQADRLNIWASPELVLEIDFEHHEKELRSALAMTPGQSRDDRLVAALEEDEKELLADEPYSDWAIRPRERLEALRQQARLSLARDRAGGAGRAGREPVVEAWGSCLLHDPACEEAAGALIRAYSAHGQHQLVVHLQALPLRRPRRLRASPITRARADLCQRHLWARSRPAPTDSSPAARQRPLACYGERRTPDGDVLCAGVTPPTGANGQDPEDLHKAVAESLADGDQRSGAPRGYCRFGLRKRAPGLVRGAETHEDDPERAVQAPSGPCLRNPQRRPSVCASGSRPAPW